jgi:predicted N-formylglutamate amidohydrolase
LSKNEADSARPSMNKLGLDAGAPAIVGNPGAGSAILLLGDHAGRAIPRALGDLGVAAAEMERHIAWDIGVAGVGAQMSQLLDATFIRQCYSRLVIDCNRDPARPDAIPAVSDGTEISGNTGLSQEEVQARRDEVFAPYHARITRELDERAGRPTALVSLHSFTPQMAGFVRPWRFGVLHLGDSALSGAMLRRLRAVEGEAAGDNQPYAMDGTDYTIPHHAIGRRLDYLELEINQALLTDAEGQRRVAEFLAPLLVAALAETTGAA